MYLLVSAFAAVALIAQSAHQSEYLALAQATLENPVTHDELRGAVLSAAGVASIRSLFEQSIDESLSFDGAVVMPELGGESMLDAGRLELVVYPDPVHPVVRGIAARVPEPAELLPFLESSAEGRFLLKRTGGLHALLYQMKHKPNPSQRPLLDDVVRNTVEQHFKTWTTDPIIQARMIEKTDWRGRYAGFWHIHPPRLKGDGFADGIEPSAADMQNAVDLGQFMTVVFQPDGFDVYDLSPLSAGGRVDLSRARRIRYRAPEWTGYFSERLRIAHGSNTP